MKLKHSMKIVPTLSRILDSFAVGKNCKLKIAARPRRAVRLRSLQAVLAKLQVPLLAPTPMLGLHAVRDEAAIRALVWGLACAMFVSVSSSLLLFPNTAHAAITVPSQTVSTAQGTGGTFSVNIPSDVSGGVLEGDWIVVVAMHTQSEDGSIWNPTWDDAVWVGSADWLTTQSTFSMPGIQVFAELAAGGESGARSASGGPSTDGWAAIAFVVRGVDTGTPLDVAVTTAEGSSVGQPNPPAITPTNDDTMILIAGFMDDTDTTGTPSAPPTNYNLLATVVQSNTPTNGRIGTAYRILSGGGGSSEDPGAWTLDGDDEWGAATISLRPAVAADPDAAGTVIFLTSGTSWNVPSDWNSSDNSIEVIGGGGGGDTNTSTGGGGGGGGAYSKVSNVTLTPDATVTIAVGSAGGVSTAGGDTYFCNSTSNCASIAGTAVQVGAKGGSGATTRIGASGGAAGSGVGDTTLSGGTGGSGANAASTGGGGGGSAAGPGGAGENGGSSPLSEGSGGGGGGGAGGASSTAGSDGSSTTGGAGGNGPDGTGGGSAGQNGTAGTGGGGGGGSFFGSGGVGAMHNTWVQTSDSANAGPGGGGGGGGYVSNGGGGGLYGGGGGGGSDDATGASGTQGIIVITYTVPFTADTTITSNSSITGGADVTNELSKGSGTFVIDHPLDPENKLLYHSFVESPDVKNIYDGIVDLNKDGEATVELPSYFLALNKDFRYQFFPIGEPMPNLYLKDEIRKRFFGLFGAPIFRIAGGIPNGRISWQVTGIRHDPYILEHPIKTEVKKGVGQSVQKGIYLHPELYD
jgi:hypothetical protein